MTKEIFKNTLLELMKEKSITEITVREICEKADMNRSTFYLHYTDVFNLLNEVEDSILSEMKSMIEPVYLDRESFIEYIAIFLKKIKDNKDTFEVLLCDPNYGSFRNKFIAALLEKTRHKLHEDDNPYENYTYRFMLHGGAHVVMEWIHSDFELTENEMARLFRDLSMSTLKCIYGNDFERRLLQEKGSSH